MIIQSISCALIVGFELDQLRPELQRSFFSSFFYLLQVSVKSLSAFKSKAVHQTGKCPAQQGNQWVCSPVVGQLANEQIFLNICSKSLH